MEPLRRTATFKKRLTSADANNIVTVLDMNIALAPYKIFESDYFVESSTLIEEFKVTVGLFSLLAAGYPETTALMSDAKKEAEIAKVRDTSQKMSLGIYTARGNGPWEYESEAVLLNQGGSENHLSLLVPFLSTNEAFLIDADFKLGVRIEQKWQGPLKTGDYLIVKGAYRQTIGFLKKNSSAIESFDGRLMAVENLLSVFAGANAGQDGTNGLVPKPLAGDDQKLLRGDRTWQPTSSTGLTLLNAADAAAGRSAIGAASLAANSFTGVQQITNTTESTNTTSGAVVIAGGAGIQKNLNVGGFLTNGGIAKKEKVITGTTPSTQGGSRTVQHFLDSTKIRSITCVVFQAGSVPIPPGYLGVQIGFSYGIACNGTHFQLDLAPSPNSQFMLDKPFIATITYTE